MSDLMKELLNDVQFIHCHICTEMFSTDPTSPLAPNASVCGHYVCVACHKKLVKANGNGGYECNYCKIYYTYTKDSQVCSGFIEFFKEIDFWLSSSNDELCSGGESSFLDFLKRFSGTTCYICKQLLASDNSPMLTPAQNNCGHYICTECEMMQRTRHEENFLEYRVTCRICGNRTRHAKSRKTNPAHGYFNLLAELHKKLLQIWSQRYQKVKCSKCKEEVGENKAVICMNCEILAKHDSNNEWKLSPLCAICIVHFHQGADHKLDTYVKMKARTTRVKKSKNIEESAKKVETLKATQDHLNTIQMETKDEINLMMTDIEKLHELAKSSPDMNYHPIIKRLGAIFHNIELSSKNQLDRMKKYSTEVKDIRRDIEAILQEHRNLLPSKRGLEEEGANQNAEILPGNSSEGREEGNTNDS